MSAAKVAFMSLAVLMRPRQLGPRMRMFRSFAILESSSSSSVPSLPASLKPALMTTADLMPAAAHSRRDAGTNLAGITMTARSISLPIRFETQELSARGIYRIETAREIEFLQIVEDREADLLGVLRSADDGYGAGIKKGVKHGVSVVEKQRRVKGRKGGTAGNGGRCEGKNASALGLDAVSRCEPCTLAIA
jgi:hypothetical protein